MPSEGTETREWMRPWNDAVSHFLTDLRKKGYSELTVRDYRMDVAELGHALEIHPDDLVREHLDELRGRPEGATDALSTRRRRMAAWRRFLRYMEEREGEPPLGQRLLRASRSGPLSDRLLVALVYLAGLRPAEIADLEGRDLRRGRGELIVQRGERVVPMHPALLDLLAVARRELPHAPHRPLLIGPQGYKLTARTVHARFQRQARAAGLAGTKPDMVRRDVAHRLRAAGAPPGLVLCFLGRDGGRALAPRRRGRLDLMGLSRWLGELPA